ncbi:hypothetical protein PAXINDRAFT_83033, partial [Paxillus involutus ATCC 200175]
PFQALSATLPPHVLAVLKHELNIPPNYIEVRLSTNRPNITYCTVPIVGGQREFRNLNCLIPPQFHPPMEIPKTLVFHDCKQDATNATIYTDARLPKQLQSQGIVKHSTVTCQPSTSNKLTRIFQTQAVYYDSNIVLRAV